jgi:hypothetical protein
VRATYYFVDLSESEVVPPLLKKYYLGRVVVTSSPLYQPMDEIERLGYELRVYVRVPDLGMNILLL